MESKTHSLRLTGSDPQNFGRLKAVKSGVFLPSVLVLALLSVVIRNFYVGFFQKFSLQLRTFIPGVAHLSFERIFGGARHKIQLNYL